MNKSGEGLRAAGCSSWFLSFDCLGLLRIGFRALDLLVQVSGFPGSHEIYVLGALTDCWFLGTLV